MATAVRTEKKKGTKTETKPKNIGKVVQVIGPVLDVEFESEHLPELYNALRVRGKTDAGVDIDVVVEVQQHIGRNQVRAVAMSSTDAVVRGMRDEDTGGPITVPVGEVKPELLKMAKVADDSMWAGITAAARGVISARGRLTDISHAIQTTIKNAGRRNREVM